MNKKDQESTMADAIKDTLTTAEPLSERSAGVVLDGRYMAPPQDKGGKTWVRAGALIQATPNELYALWRNIEFAPMWQEMVTDVISTGPKTSHWVMNVNGKSIEWDSEILADEPGRRIAWRSTGGDSQNAGEVVFDRAPGGRGTLVTVLQEFGQGKMATAAQTVVSRNPKQAVIENLRHFKAFAETGEIPRTEGQPHGPRGASGSLKASLYGEKVGVPPGDTGNAR
jgi:uncharacterized membrane protein